MLRVGYLLNRPKSNSGNAMEHTATAEVTSRAHWPADLLLSMRNRVDLGWAAGDPNHRYRNQLKLAWTFDAGRFQFAPYAHAEVVSSGSAARALGYMMDGSQPARNGELVHCFFLMPDAGSTIHPAHRFGDQMIEVRLVPGDTVRFNEGSLVWVSGTWRNIPGDPNGHDPLLPVS